jgi:cytochrome P450
MLGEALKYLARDARLQEQLRAHPEQIPEFIEECLRLESRIRADTRLARRSTTLAGIDIPAGTSLALFLGAANRDPQRFDHPGELRLGRPNCREHVAFGRGIHSCPGGPLARSEGRIAVEPILARTRDLSLSEAHHGRDADQHFTYEPSWLLRALRELNIEFRPVRP